MFKNILFFVVVIATLMYLRFFWNNRHEKTKVQLFTQKTDMSLGALMLAIFLDGAIIASLLIWLLN